jgi:uncharacterized membrane protein
LIEPSASAPTVAGRVISVDILRGVVMVIMALDHVRDFFTNVRFAPEDLTQTSLPLFFTRWITHFCAPSFVFLAGVGAGLSAARGRPRQALARFLLSRGAWLIIAELTVVRFGWTFNLDYSTQVWVQVIWAIGWSMIVLAGLIYLPSWLIAAFGIGMIAAHNLLDPIGLDWAGPTLVGAGLRDWIWAILHVPRLPVIYPLIPWIGVMAVGYVFAPLLLRPDPPRRRTLFQIGGALTLAFVLLRASNLYGDPHPWQVEPRPGMTLASFLNAQKYPPSLLYLLMTLGPAIMLLPLFERWRGWLATFFDTVGRVPFFYYVAHIYLIHAIAGVLLLLRSYPSTLVTNPFFSYPDSWGFGLPVIYGIWVAAVLLLYPACRWFAGVKERRRDLWWLGYL